ETAAAPQAHTRSPSTRSMCTSWSSPNVPGLLDGKYDNTMRFGPPESDSAAQASAGGGGLARCRNRAHGCGTRTIERKSNEGNSMRRLLTTTRLACPLAAPALAEDTVVPVEKAPYHRPVFHNDLVMLLSVYLPPGAPRGPEVYHTHSLDQISVLAQAADMTNQALGEPAMGPARRGQRGNVGYTAFSKKPQTHRGANVATTPFHNIVVALLYPQPGRFTAGSRAEAPGYQQLIDNDRVRAWRLTLEPGQSVAAITQRAPGM